MIFLAFWGNILPKKHSSTSLFQRSFPKGDTSYEYELRSGFNQNWKEVNRTDGSFLKGSSAFLVNKWMVCFLKGYLKFYHESVFLLKIRKTWKMSKNVKVPNSLFSTEPLEKEWKIKGQVMCLPNKHCHLWKVYWYLSWKKWENMKTSPKVYLDVFFLGDFV